MANSGETVQRDRGEADIQASDRIQNDLDAGLVTSPLAGYICHDLRHPLSAILAYSELLAEDSLDRLQRADFHSEIRRAVSWMNDLISLLLEFSKGTSTSRTGVTDIVETIERAIHIVAVRPEFRRIVIDYDHEGLTEGRLDPRRLRQVIINVVLNACEAVSPRTGRIRVRSVGRKESVEISVWDNGHGVPQSLRNAIFQPFVSHGKEAGTGLGLAIVQKILHDQGGEIYLDTSREDGTLFRIVVPLVRHPNDGSPQPNAMRGRNPALLPC